MNKRRRFKAHRRRRARLLAQRQNARRYWKTLLFNMLYGRQDTSKVLNTQIAQRAIGAGYLKPSKLGKYYRYAPRA